MYATSAQSTEKIIIEHVKEDHHEEREHDKAQESKYDTEYESELLPTVDSDQEDEMTFIRAVTTTSERTVEDGNGKIFINESLTSYRKRLFGRIREYKRDNNSKYLWTSNGKIMLKVNDTSPTQAFVTREQFEDYLDQISNH